MFSIAQVMRKQYQRPPRTNFLERYREKEQEEHRERERKRERKREREREREKEREMERVRQQERERQKKQERERQKKQDQILQALRLSMDPLIAAQVYNNNYCLLSSLPEELLLIILHYLVDDAVALCCLRRVSRTLRRLVDDPSIHESSLLQGKLWPELAFLLPKELASQLRHLLQKDGMCDSCKLWCVVPVEGSHRQRDQARNLEEKHRRYWPGGGGQGCKFEPLGLRRPPTKLYCDACDEHHSAMAFSPINQDPAKQDRRCLGHEGAVQLCEHIHIDWITIKNHIATWQKYKPGDWQACFDNFLVECDHPAHDACCVDGVPVYPRARLLNCIIDTNQVMLELVWKPHSGLDAFTDNTDGRISAPELRSLFQKYRQGPAGIHLPSYHSSSIPEMACFRSHDSWISYKINGKESPVDVVQRHAFPRGFARGWLEGGNTASVDVTRHWPRDMVNSGCLIATYRRTILVCTKQDYDKIIPTHAWFHAMDPDTYHRPQQALPLCKDKNCMNFYRKPNDFQCIHILKPYLD